MPIETISFGGSEYPKLQSEGFAAKFAFPFAQAIGIGIPGQVGYDVGCHKIEWCLPNAIPVEPIIDELYDALNFPLIQNVDYIFSSHMLEHTDNWVEVLDYWATKLKVGGVLFLYLPHPDQNYWKPWNNRKHVHLLFPEVIESYLKDRGWWDNIFVTKGYDLNHSFYVTAQRK